MTGAELPMYEGCTLEPTQLEEQLARYRGLAPHVIEVRQRPEQLSVEFAADVPQQPLADALEVERQCCSFLAIAYDRDARRLTIAVESSDQEPVLAALAAALSDYRAGAERSLGRAASEGWTVVSIKRDWSTVFTDART